MYYLLAMITLIVLGTIASGFYLTAQPAHATSSKRLRQSIIFNILMFTMAMLGITPVIQSTMVKKFDLDSNLGLAVGALTGSLISATATHPMDTIKVCLYLHLFSFGYFVINRLCHGHKKDMHARRRRASQIHDYEGIGTKSR